MKDNYLFLSKTDSLQGNFENRLQHYLQYALCKDSILNEARQK